MRAATVVQQLCKSCRTCFYVLLHVLFYLWSLLKRGPIVEKMATKQSLRPSAGQNPSVTEYEMAFCGQHAPTAIRSSTYGDLYVPRVATYRYGWQAFAVSGPQLSNQWPAATRATCSNTPDYFKRALKASLLGCSLRVMLQITAPLIQRCSEELFKGGGLHNQL